MRTVTDIITAENLTVILILLPFAAALGVFFIRSARLQSVVVLVTGCLLIASALLLIPLTPFQFSPRPILGLSLNTVVQALDFLLLVIILYFGVRHRKVIITALALFQICFLAYFEFFMIRGHQPSVIFLGDHLSLIMILIVAVVGSLICFQAIPYMREHEAERNLKKSRQHRFFFVMVLFLSAMNGLVLSNDMVYFYFFFEITTLCSFLLIAHDGTPLAITNALRALWMNSLGGAAFILALIGIYAETGTIEFQKLLISGEFGQGILQLSLVLLCLAAITKSAQFPFQSWLLGAMVAPTPVSALLHSSTMVKVGVYLVLRLTPALNHTFLSQCVALFGAFTFISAAALAVGQSNGKKILAYSTISNLGLIFACCGLNTAESLTAAMLLIIFHAVVKALLFLCVGAIEQHIASRDIEQMRGLYADMPLTALITVMGVIMMIMPPFGMLLSKWMAMESAAANIYVILMISLGSALTVMYWARWAGTLMSYPFTGKFKPERQPWLTWISLGSLCAGAGLLSIGAPWLYLKMVLPVLGGQYLPPFSTHQGILDNPTGVFAVVPLSVVAILGLFVAILAVRKATDARVVSPYLSGSQSTTPGMFVGPLNRLVEAGAKNYYLSTIFGERRLTPWINIGAVVLLTLMAGGAL